ncbi:hypothetical protein G9A89_014182 [Geosiphon pyriformis]|nr:hypothetical protein G9A89_014182 [Geosiphon pyriformis]
MPSVKNFGDILISYINSNSPPVNTKTTTTAVIGIAAGLSLLVASGIRRSTIFQRQTITSNTEKEEQKHAQEINEKLASHPLVQELRSSDSFQEYIGYPYLKEETRKYHFTAATLVGKGRFAIPPIVFFNRENMELVAFLHIGRDMCSHDGIVHGGLLATIMDEILARTVIPCLPDLNGATAFLHINYRAPCVADQFVKCSGKVTKLEGRKGFVEGKIETLENGLLIVDGNALFLSIKKLGTPK